MGDDLPKLVRDRIPDIIEEEEGSKPETRRVDDTEAVEFLREKVVEEAEEFSESGELEELADLMEVIDRYLELCGEDRESLEELRKEKAEERGKFTENIILEEIQ